jgi:hypothetical protein
MTRSAHFPEPSVLISVCARATDLLELYPCAASYLAGVAELIRRAVRRTCGLPAEGTAGRAMVNANWNLLAQSVAPKSRKLVNSLT